MISITYISKETAPFSSIDFLKLLDHCQKNNPLRGITGMLIYGNGTFLQCVEGESTDVEQLLEKIKIDSRHKDLKILSNIKIQNRLFNKWDMGFERLTEESIAQAPGLNSFAYQNFNANYLIENSSAVESLLSRHRSQHLDPLAREIDARDKLIHELQRALAAARHQNEMTSLLIESLLASAQQNIKSSAHIDLCRNVLKNMKRIER